jgi:large subunit ribosomal protein L1
MGLTLEAHTRSSACLCQRFMSGKAFTPLQAAIEEVRKGSGRNFTESVDVAIRLNIDPRKADQALRGLAVLPHGTGKQVRVVVFATGAAAEAATKAGATVVGTDDLVEKIKDGFLDFDRAVATPACMKFATKVARVLGPRGLMPNAKLGTVTDDIEGIIQQLNSGVPYKADKEGNIHAAIAKTSFDGVKLEENLLAFIRTLNDVKPKSISGQYMLDVFLSASMGPSYRVQLTDIQTKLFGATAQADGAPQKATRTKVGCIECRMCRV